MASRRHAKRCCQIEILLLFGVPHVHAARVLPHDGPRAVRIDECDIARFVIAKLIQGGGAAVHLNRRKLAKPDSE